MGFDIMVDYIGEIDSRKDTFGESIYLLDENHRIIGMRLATNPTGATPNMGENFFDCFPASVSEVRTVSGMTNMFNAESLLLRAGNRPVLILFALYARTRLLVAVVPEDPVREVLDHPAPHADLFRECHLLLSAESLARSQPLTEQNHRIVFPFVQKLEEALFYQRMHYLEHNAPLLNAVARINRIAALCGCALSYDFTGIEYAGNTLPEFDLLVSTVFAVLLTVHRTAGDRRVTFIAGNIPGSGPMVGANFTCDDGAESFPELLHLQYEARARGEQFMFVKTPDNPNCILLQFSLCHKELSEQESKQKPVSQYHTVHDNNYLPYSIPDSEEDTEGNGKA